LSAGVRQNQNKDRLRIINSLPNAGVITSSGCGGFWKEFGSSICHDSSAHKSGTTLSSFRSLNEVMFGSVCNGGHASNFKMAGKCRTASGELLNICPCGRCLIETI
jgi:hypothetical protein